MKGYKASYNGKCMNNFHYEVGRTYEFYGKPVCRQYGYHFCQDVDDVLNYYPFHKDFVLFEVEAPGIVVVDGDKSCTNKIKILRIIPREEYNSIFKNLKLDDDLLGYWIKYQYLFKEVRLDKYGNVIWEKDEFGKEYEYNYKDGKLIKKGEE
jgi:hypothetical protein